MDSRRRQNHVGANTGTCRMNSLTGVLLMLSALWGCCSCMLFNTRDVQHACIPWLSAQTVQLLTQGMSNMTNLESYLLPNIAVPRVSGTRGNGLVREFIRTEMTSLGWHVDEDQFQDWTPYGEIPFSNVIATLDPTVTKRIVLACHYDSKRLPGFVAASDSAVPCSIMIETARWLGQMVSEAYSQGNIDFTLQLIFFDGEEAFLRWTEDDSLYGSKHLAELWERTPDRNDPAVNSLKNIKFFILLDLIGTSDTRFVNYYSNTTSLYRRMVTIEYCLKRLNLLSGSVYLPAMFSPRGTSQNVEDDHTPFIHRGVPVLHLISTPFPSVWHTTQDNIQNLDFRLIDNFSRILRVFLASLLIGS